MVTMARIVTKFALLGGAEEAIIGWTMLAASAPLSDLISADAANQNDMWLTWDNHFPLSTSVVERKVEELDPGDGHVVSTTGLDLPTAPAGTGSGNAYPPQLARVMTIRTGLSGRSFRGRFYLPPPAIDENNASASIPLTTRQDLVNAFATYCGDVFTASDFQLGVWSPTLAGFESATSVDMGSIYDTQRRRRSTLVEARYSVSL